LKSSNRLLNVLSSIFAKENDLDNCVLLNEQKNIVEFSNANLFLVQGNHIRTPQLSDGCIKGISRKKVIEILETHTEYTLEETSISSFDLQKADEVFLTNAIIGVQSVTHYRKKKYATEVGTALSKAFDLLEG
jgi:branched-chain amino acid aminotransferase